MYNQKKTNGAPGPEALDRLEAGQMYEGGVSIKGRILISFLALFCMSMIRFLYPRFRSKTAESISEELSSFTLTVFTRRNGGYGAISDRY